jgi:hypothetical protein
MWAEAKNHDEQLQLAIAFTCDAAEYGRYMRRVVREWPLSCENALTDQALNKKAWVGHAACALAHNLPEHIVREAWSHLSDEQQFLANQEAARAVAEWENAYASDRRLHADMGGTLLCGRDPR